MDWIDRLLMTESLLTLGAIIALLLFSGFFSGSETALTTASRATMHKLQQDGVPAAKQVNQLKAKPERLIGAILLGNNLVNILASALATALFLNLFGEAGVALATIFMTFVVLVFAEILPKTLAIARTNRLAMFVAPLISVFVIIFAPVVDLIQHGVRRLVHLFGVDIAEGEDVLSAHERLRGVIDLHHEEGEVVKWDRDMLGGILDLQELEVADVMIHRKSMEMIDAGQPNDVIVQEVLKSAHTRLPLWREDPENIVGILHQKDLLRALSRVSWDASKLDVESIALKPWFVPETTELSDQLNAFLRDRLHFALVVD
jgi:Mg2+/Co2+ transporter CorB